MVGHSWPVSPAELSCCALAKPLEGAPGNQQACAQIPGISEDTGRDPAQGVVGARASRAAGLRRPRAASSSPSQGGGGAGYQASPRVRVGGARVCMRVRAFVCVQETNSDWSNYVQHLLPDQELRNI